MTRAGRRGPAAAARAVAAVVLTGVLAVALAGCSDDDEAPAEEPRSDVDASLDESLDAGFAAIGRDDAAAAEEAFDRALDEDPDNLLALYNLGQLAQADGRETEAVERYVAALDADPDYAPALYNLAILTEDSDLRLAVDLYRRAADAAPEDAAVQVRLGYALVDLGRPAAGRAAIERGEELDPGLEGVGPD